MKKLISVSLCLLGSISWAEPRTQHVLKTELKNAAFTGTLKEGYHFNDKAPNALTLDGKMLKPAKLNTREVEFSPLPAKFASGQAALYVCDDAITFCETRTVDLKAGKTVPMAAKKSGKSIAGKVNENGFIEDDFNGALSQAQKKKALLLVDFAARWCPSCVRLEQEIFNSPEFKKMTQDYVKLKIDTDHFENGVLAEKFAVKGMPTMMVMNTDQEEIARMMDFQPIEIWQKFFSAVKADPVPLRELKAKAADPETRLRLGRRLWAADQAEDAVPVLEKITPRPKEYWDARVDAVEGKDKTIQMKTYMDALAAESDSTRSLGWRAKLLEVMDLAAEKKRILDQGLALADSFLADDKKLTAALATDTTGEYTGYERLMVAIYRADLVDASDAKPEEKAEAWGKAVQVGLDSKVPIENVGINMRLISFMNQSKRYADADKLTEAILKKYPGNTDIKRRRMNVLVQLKKFDGAIQLGPEVMKDSYGRNEFWAAEVLARAYVGAGRTQEARQFIDKYLSRNEIEWPSLKSTRKALEDLRQKIPQG